MKAYNPAAIEPKWQKYWQAKKTFAAKDFNKKPKKYILMEFPYPSGDGLHMGHVRGYTAGDVHSRYLRAKGHEVLYPIGWDAFGLPAENYAIKKGIHPTITTKKNIINAKKQFQSWGMSFDWDREINTTDPEYYKWTQWLFLQFYKAGLAYEATGMINWCPKDKTGLANEEVIDGKCERCGTIVEKKELRQWYLRITAYAEQLLEGLKTLDQWPDPVKTQQENWIGKSVGVEVVFDVEKHTTETPKSILIGTRNEAKFRMIKECLPDMPGVKLLSLNDVTVDDSKLVEGDDFEMNARMKAEFYFKKTGIPTISTDNVFWVEKWPKNGGVIVHMRKLANPKSARASDEEVVSFFQKFLKKVGGTSKANFRYAIAFTDSRGTKNWTSVQRDYILQSKTSEKYDKGYPAESLLIDAVTGEPKGAQPDSVRYNALIQDFSQKVTPYILNEHKIQVYTTRLDTIFSGTFIVLAPEHPLVETLTTSDQKKAVAKYLEKTKKLSDIQRQDVGLEKTGVDTGSFAINPATGDRMPIWVSDFVIGSYGSGAVFADAHDERDFELAKKFNIPLKVSLRPQDEDMWQKVKNLEVCFPEEGTLVNSAQFDGLTSAEAREKILDWLEVKGAAHKKINYKLRDWVFSRQRYWGEPIPIIHCEKCGIVPVPEKDLPVKLPPVKKYEPTGTGESPLAAITKWVNVKCPTCKGKAKRETNTMPQWAGSSWYWLRYVDPKDKKKFSDLKKQKYWTPVDVYFGGMEHTTLHLLYARFWNLFLYDQGLVTAKEPFTKRLPHGIILASDGEKMSKSRGNVVNPDTIVQNFGADTLRMYELFLGPHEMAVSWNDQGISGVSRFLDRIWTWVNEIAEAPHQKNPKSEIRNPKVKDTEKVEVAINKLIKRVTQDLERFSFNTAIPAFMEFHNEIKQEFITLASVKAFLVLLHPFAPHIAEELYSIIGGKKSIQLEPWPSFDEAKTISKQVDIMVQINGKVRGKISVPYGSSEETVKAEVMKLDVVVKSLVGETVKRAIYVPNRLMNIVI